MFKKHLNMLSTPLTELFIVNNTMHDHFARQHNNLHIDIGFKKNMYRLFNFYGTHIWNHIYRKTISIDVSYACFKNLSKMNIQANDIPYRII